MAINGITEIRDGNCFICYIDDLSDELKDLIRGELNIICYGKNQVEDACDEFYSYKKTLADFLVRYSTKTDETKMGILGEFIAHLIINKVIPILENISILFNKEELSIKKGFDLNFLHNRAGVIWYGEVKSGKKDASSTADEANIALLNRAKRGVSNLLTGSRPNLWESVIIDVSLSFNNRRKKRIQELLRSDIREITEDSDTKKNSILISVLFHNSSRRITQDRIKEYLSEVTSDDLFSDVIVFSIQKSTYTKIERFLRNESIG